MVPGHEPFDSRILYMPTLNGQITRRWKSVDAALGVGGARRTVSFRFPPPPHPGSRGISFICCQEPSHRHISARPLTKMRSPGAWTGF